MRKILHEVRIALRCVVCMHCLESMIRNDRIWDDMIWYGRIE